MYINLKDLQKIKDNPAQLEKYVELHNKAENKSFDLHSFYFKYFMDNQADYDQEALTELVDAYEGAHAKFEDFAGKL